MKTFDCVCGQVLFFENSRCLQCGREAGFVPRDLRLHSIELREGGWVSLPGALPVRKCANYVEHGVCNWLVNVDDAFDLCIACRLNNVIPDLSDPENIARWGEVERAKRRLVYSLLGLGLPVVPKADAPATGLAFDIKADLGDERVFTGHSHGIVTLNLAEADPVMRERLRVEMNERYRTLLGHFRHESGHYYWQVLVAGSPAVWRFRELFGDETVDYEEALERHYGTAAAPPPSAYVSHYATAHPWEDWAETWASYLHMVDTLETAAALGVVAPGAGATDFDRLVDTWLDLTVTLNELNRSMGHPDANPFQLTAAVREKLRFVHEVVGRE